jgi:16S rRNA processing protein RimM
MSPTKQISVGKIIGPHGLRGLVRLRSFTDDPVAIETYPVTDAAGVARTVTLKSPMAQEFIADVAGITNREQAEAAKGMELFVARDQLPALGTTEYYLADLVGLRADDPNGAAVGTVHAVHDFGAGVVLDIKLPNGQTAMLPFRNAFVPTVAVQAGYLVLTPPDDWLTVGKAPTP